MALTLKKILNPYYVSTTLLISTNKGHGFNTQKDIESSFMFWLPYQYPLMKVMALTLKEILNPYHVSTTLSISTNKGHGFNT
jgi:hypothetical protein